MYCLLQIYVSVSTELAPHKPLLKLLSIKVVGKMAFHCIGSHFLTHFGLSVFLTFWQATFLSVLGWFGVVKAVGH